MLILATQYNKLHVIEHNKNQYNTILQFNTKQQTTIQYNARHYNISQKLTTK